MSLNWEKLVSQGRAKAPGVPWSDEEHQAVLALSAERGLHWLTAADYVRNGVMTSEAYDAATKADFKPKTLKEAAEDSLSALKEAGASFGAKTRKRKTK